MSNEVHYTTEGLGITASHRRNIKDGRCYDHLFPPSLGTDPILKQGDVQDTVKLAQKIVYSTLSQSKKLATMLKPSVARGNYKPLFDFFYQHYQYKLDKFGVEQLRNPARAWKDRKKGIDCDCFSISVSSVLTNLGIPHYLRIIKIKNRDYFQHIYVVVPKFKGANMNIRNQYIVIDPVLDHYDEEAPEITEKQDTYMSIPIQYLNGVGDLPGTGKEFDGLGDGLGCACGMGLVTDFNKRLKLHAHNMSKHIAKHPHVYRPYYKPEALKGMYDQLFGAFGSEQELQGMLEHLSAIEESALQPHLQGLGSVMHGDDDGLYTVLHGDQDDAMFAGLNGLGQLGKAKKKVAAKKAGKKTGVFTKLKNANKKIKTAVKKGVKKVGAVAKKIAKAAVKGATLPVRAGFLVAMRTNVGRLASRAYWGAFPLADARKAGVKEAYWQRSKNLYDKLVSVFKSKLQGDESTLKKAIINGRAAKKIAKGKVNGVNGLGIVGAAASGTAVASAMAFLTPILKWAKTLFKGSKGGEMTENGGETMDVTSDDPNVATTQTDTDTTATAPADNSVTTAARAASEEEPTMTAQSSSALVSTNTASLPQREIPAAYDASTMTSDDTAPADTASAVPATTTTPAAPAADTTTDPADTTDTTTTDPPKKGGGGGAILLGLAALAAGGWYIATRNNKKKATTNGVDGLAGTAKKAKVKRGTKKKSKPKKKQPKAKAVKYASIKLS